MRLRTKVLIGGLAWAGAVWLISGLTEAAALSCDESPDGRHCSCIAWGELCCWCQLNDGPHARQPDLGPGFYRRAVRP